MTSFFKKISESQPEKRVIGFSGSPRRSGNSDLLLKKIVSGVKEGQVDAGFWNLTDFSFSGCIGCERCRKSKICTGLNDGMSLLYPEIISSRGLILVCPTHNYNVTSWMKAFIDRLYCFYNFENDHPRSWSSQLENQSRKAVIASVCEQESAEDMGFTMDAMIKPVEALGYEVVGELRVFKIFEKGKVKKDEKSMDKAFELGLKLAASLNENE